MTRSLWNSPASVQEETQKKPIGSHSHFCSSIMTNNRYFVHRIYIIILSLTSRLVWLTLLNASPSVNYVLVTGHCIWVLLNVVQSLSINRKHIRFAIKIDCDLCSISPRSQDIALQNPKPPSHAPHPILTPIKRIPSNFLHKLAVWKVKLLEYIAVKIAWYNDLIYAAELKRRCVALKQ